ncbi:MAG TPA: TOBE-like domain-containing protein [Phycisphaerae bacterium]|nr:TOBE-like domain-containing protein [Phycisphaerae bacterium]
MSILAKNITKRFGGKVALDRVTVEAPSGQLVALLGPSGCGKTTLLRIIAGLEFPDEGQVLFEGEDATGQSARQRGVGFVFQHYALFKHMNIFENVAFSLRVRKRPKEEVESRVAELLKLVQLDDMAKRYPAQLSGGQRQRIALARALAARPKVLLLDEPFGALDAQVRKDLRRWLRKLHDEIHVTSLFVTHDQEEALEVSDRVVIFSPGKVEQVGTPEEVYNQPANPFVLQFLGHVNIFHGRLQGGGAEGGGAEGAGAGESKAEGVKSYVRPHEIELVRADARGEAEGKTGTMGRVVWVHRAGATVKVELEVEGTGQLVVAEVARDKWAGLALERGERVLVVAKDSRVFAGDWEI